VKPLYEGGLAEVVSHAWWESNGADQRVEENKAAYFTACHKIKEAIASKGTQYYSEPVRFYIYISVHIISFH
jgi:hypothetical protein